MFIYICNCHQQLLLYKLCKIFHFAYYDYFKREIFNLESIIKNEIIKTNLKRNFLNHFNLT